MKLLLITLTIFCLCQSITGQIDFIYTKEGQQIMDKKPLIYNCLKSLKKTKADAIAMEYCECQLSKINRYFSNKQVRKHTIRGIINIGSLIESDSIATQNINECFKNTGQTKLLSAQSMGDESVLICYKSIKENTEKKLDSLKVIAFCSCQLQLIKEKKLTDAKLEALQNPNSILFYEMMYTCGNPFEQKTNETKNWNPNRVNDLKGPSVDTLSILNLDGMTYLKIKIGSLVYFWLFDTGATDFLITKEMEKTLLIEQVLTDANYLGVGQYEMANGEVENCKRYTVNNIKIGDYNIDNIVVAVSEKSKKIIAGKTLFNKFKSWSINNELNKLILWKY